MMRQGGLFTVATAAFLAGGCALGPGAEQDRSVTHDVVDYLHREWPLAGPPVIPAESCPSVCGCGHGGCAQGACDRAANDCVWSDDWNQAGRHPHATGASDDPPPVAPLDPPPPGRFFPAPVRPVFASQELAPGVIGPMSKVAE